MNTCASSGNELSWWNRDLASGLCAPCARRTAKERKERQKKEREERKQLAASMSKPANEEDLKQKLDKLQAQGSLSNEERAHIQGALQENKSAPRKMFWLRVGQGPLQGRQGNVQSAVAAGVCRKRGLEMRIWAQP